MREIKLKARAKINLSLDVLRKRPDGYHEVKMIMQTLALHDVVKVNVTDEGIRIHCNSPWVPNDDQNIAYKAAVLMIQHFKIQKGVSIDIDKRIPVAAGLAGGSSNAAAVLKAMNELFSLGIQDKELMSIGKTIGADVPYCIKGGTMLSEGIGEILSPLDSMPEIPILLIKPKIGVSTGWVYKNLQADKIQSRPMTDDLIQAISKKDMGMLSSNMKNVLEGVTIPKHPIIQEIKEKLLSLGASGSMMSGSGPTVFGIFETQEVAKKAWEDTHEDSRWESILTHTEG